MRSTADMCTEAIMSLKDRSGSSCHAIKTYIFSAYREEPTAQEPVAALAKDDIFIKNKGKFKLNTPAAGAKKPPSGRFAELERSLLASRRRAAELRAQADEYDASASRTEEALELERGKQARTAAFHAGGGSLLAEETTDDTLLHIARFLNARDLLRLKLTYKRLSIKCIHAPSGGGGAAAAAPERLCIAEEAARRWLAGCTQQERDWAPAARQ